MDPIIELKYLDRGLAPNQQLDAYTIATLKPLLDNPRARVHYLAAKILLEHNHDITLQTEDGKRVPLSFAVLSKFSEIFPEDSSFLCQPSSEPSHPTPPISIPISSTSLDLVLRLWKGAPLNSIIEGGSPGSKLEALLEGTSYLSTAGSPDKPQLFFQAMHPLQPVLGYCRLPRPGHVELAVSNRRWDGVMRVLPLIKAFGYTSSLTIDPINGGELDSLQKILKLEETHPLHSLTIIGYKGWLAGCGWVAALKGNTTLKRLELHLPRLERSAALQLAEVFRENHTIEELHLNWGNSNKELSLHYLVEALKLNQGVKKLSIFSRFENFKSNRALAETLQANTTLEDLTVDGFSRRQAEDDLVAALEKNTTLKNVLLKPTISESSDLLIRLANFVQNNPNLEGLSLSFRSLHGYCGELWEDTFFLDALRAAPSLKLLQMKRDYTYLPRRIEQLVAHNTSLEKLDLSKGFFESSQERQAFVEGLRKNQSLRELHIDLQRSPFILDELLKAIGQHPKLVSLKSQMLHGHCSDDVAIIAEFLAMNPPLQRLSLRSPPNTRPFVLDSEVFSLVANALRQNTQLKALELKGWKLSEGAMGIFAELLETRQVLEELTLTQPRWSEKRLTRVISTLAKNQSLKSLTLGQKPAGSFEHQITTGKLLAALLPDVLKKNQSLRTLRLKGFFVERASLLAVEEAILQKEYFNLEF